MKYPNVKEIVSTNLTNIQNCLEEIIFMRQTKHLWMLVRLAEKFREHGTPCKIRTPTDKNCGNEGKIRLMGKFCCFMPIFLPPLFLTKKHMNFRILWDTPDHY
jgi:hypothetical protein